MSFFILLEVGDLPSVRTGLLFRGSRRNWQIVSGS